MDTQEVQKLMALALKTHEEGNYSKAEQFFLEALYLIDDKETPSYQTLVYGLGLNYAMQGNYEGAKSCFQEGRFNARKANNIDFELEMLHELVIVCRKADELDAAGLLSEEEIRYRHTYAQNDYTSLAAAYYEGARVFMMVKDFKKSKIYLDEALKQVEKVQDDRTLGLIYMGIGDLHVMTNNKKIAMESYQLSKDIYDKYDVKKVLDLLQSRIKIAENLKNE